MRLYAIQFLQYDRHSTPEMHGAFYFERAPLQKAFRDLSARYFEVWIVPVDANGTFLYHPPIRFDDIPR